MFSELKMCFTPLLNAYDYVFLLQASNLCRALVNVAADFVLVPIYGLNGAAYGTMIAMIIGLIVKIAIVFLKKNEILKVVGS